VARPDNGKPLAAAPQAPNDGLSLDPLAVPWRSGRAETGSTSNQGPFKKDAPGTAQAITPRTEPGLKRTRSRPDPILPKI